MNNIIIKISRISRIVELDNSTVGIVGENLQDKLVFIFTDDFIDGVARLEYDIDGDKKYILLDKEAKSYSIPIKNVLLFKDGNIKLQLVITEDKTGTPVFKSEIFDMYCKKSINAVSEAPSSYELWIETANRILLEASRVDINGNKENNTTYITIYRKDGTTKTFEIKDGEKGDKGDTGDMPDMSNYYTKTETNELLANKVGFTDYATKTTGGVIKASDYFEVEMNNVGEIKGITRTYSHYTRTMPNNAFISKGTLENVITGKDLTTKTYVDGLVGDIGTILDSINNEVL